jgi:TPR repeat protein
MYKEGKGVKQDNFKALKFFQKACDLNYFIRKSKIKATTARIQITRLLGKLERLEIILFNAKGKGVKQDNFKALKFFQKACDLNYGGGCSNLGFMYKNALKSSCLTPLPFLYINPRLKQPLP